MSSKTLTKRTVRLACVLGAGFAEDGNLIDGDTGEAPRIAAANDTDFEIGVFIENPFLSNDPVIYDLDDVATVTLEVLASQTTEDGELVDKSVAAVDITNSFTYAEWAAETKEHLTVSCTGAELNLDLGAAAAVDFWMVITAFLDDGSEHTLAGGTLTLVEDNNDSGGSPPANPGNTMSTAAIQAYVATLSGVDFSDTVAAANKNPVIPWPDAPLGSPPSVVLFTLESDDGIAGTIQEGSIDEDGFTLNLTSSDHNGFTIHVHYKM